MAFWPSTGRNPSPGRNSTGAIASTLTYRPGPAGVPPGSVVKWLAALPSDLPSPAGGWSAPLLICPPVRSEVPVLWNYRAVELQCALDDVGDPADALVDEVVGDPAVGEPDLVA